MRWPPRVEICREGRPYLVRYYLLGTGRTPGIFVHHLLASDSKLELHDHPWRWAVSLVLLGGYREQRREADGRVVDRWVAPGRLNRIGGDAFHRIELRGGRPAWTLFFHGPVAKGWGFLDLATGAFRRWVRTQNATPTP